MDLIEEQLQAFNTCDIDRFLTSYSPDIVIEDGDGNILVKGEAAMRERYSSLFKASPELKCKILNRIRIGKYAIDEEEITGYQGAPGALHTVVIYRLEGDKITHVRILR